MDDSKLLEQANKIRKGYVSVTESEEDMKLSFIDELNSLVRLIFRDEPVDAYTLISEEELLRWKKSRVKRLLKRIVNTPVIKIFYASLLAAIVIFLISEAINFYSNDGVITLKTYVQAILTEVCFVFLNGYRSEGRINYIFTFILRACMFLFMLFVVTAETALHGTKDISKVDSLTDRIARIERQIEKNEQDIEKFKSMNWNIRMTQAIASRNKLEDELRRLLEQKELSGASDEVSSIMRYKIYAKAFFRIMLIMISVLITRRLFSF
jgi:hypothetical protein